MRRVTSFFIRDILDSQAQRNNADRSSPNDHRTSSPPGLTCPREQNLFRGHPLHFPPEVRDRELPVPLISWPGYIHSQTGLLFPFAGEL